MSVSRRTIHQQKVDKLIEHMALQYNLHPYTVAPPIYRFLWSLGILVRPPMYLNFWAIVLINAIMFGGLWGVVMYFTLWRGRISSWQVALIAAGAGLSFGLAMAAYYRYKVGKWTLPPWDSLGEGE
jgi:Family of unknown function (DUF6404)